MDKVLVKLYIPILEKKFDILIPLNRKIYNVIDLLLQGIYELVGENYETNNIPLLYDQLSGKVYHVNLTVKEAGIVNGTEIILI